MSRVSPQIRNIARRLIAYESRAYKSAETRTLADFSACEKLRPHLAMLMGKGGFRALLSRSLAVANAEVLWLRAVHVRADGSLEGLDELHRQLKPEELFEGGVVLLAQLLTLLVAFIGVNLTVGVLRDIWPAVPISDLDFTNRQNERVR